MITEKVNLIEGVVLDGKRYKKLTLRAPIMRDEMQADEECEGKQGLKLSMALVIKCITEWEGIPEEKIDIDLLAMLSTEDFERLYLVREYLKKKAHWSSID